MKNTTNYLIFKLSVILILVLVVNVTYAANDLTGRVIYHNAEETPLEGVAVHLNDLEGVLLQTTFSNDVGYFSFSGLESGTYKITATSDNAPPSVVNLLDVSLLIDYLNSQEALDPLEEEAADVNGNSEIDNEDLIFLLENWYLHGESFPAGNWVFEEKTAMAGGKEGEIVINGACVADISSDYEPDKKTGSQLSREFQFG